MGLLEDIATNSTYQGIIAIIIVISAIFGIITYFKKEKPKIELDFVDANWFKRNEHSIVTSLGIHIRIHNRGGKNTTVHSATLEIEYDGKKFSIDTEHHNMMIESGGSILKQFIFNLSLDQVVINTDISNAKLSLKHTYDSKEIDIPLIKKPVS